MLNTFVCADLHFSHKNIIVYENRPFRDIDEMDEILVRNWNAKVKQADTVFVLGDVAFGTNDSVMSLIPRLNGRKTLVMGNHDHSRPVAFWQEAGFEVVSPYPIIYKEFLVLMHEPPTYFNRHTPYYYLYGHVHNTPDYQDHTEYSACVSMERIQYLPALLEDVISGAAFGHRRILPNAE